MSNNKTIEEKCTERIKADEELTFKFDGLFCNTSYDGVLCWPRTRIDTVYHQPCFDEFLGVYYDVKNNASRYCTVSGLWDKSNYGNCLHITNHTRTCNDEMYFDPKCPVLTSFIYYVGYSLSFLSLLFAIIIFINFKDLRCLRNTIHINLFLTYILWIILWILSLTLQMFVGPGTVGCIFLAIFLHYFYLTNFFWMMVEGLYLYMLVVQTFAGDNIRFNLYAVIGWGFPSVIVGFWAVFKAFATHDKGSKEADIECEWMRETHHDWIIKAPACLVLIINLIFLIRIMFVLITKLRSANSIETRQYHKAAKALLVLIPLLGITYLIVIYGPDGGVESHIFSILQAVLLSTQGFWVALFYCFFNTEVRQALKHRMNRWRDRRNLSTGSSIRSRRYTMSRDYSPKSRTESIRTTHESYTVIARMTEL